MLSRNRSRKPVYILGAAAGILFAAAWGLHAVFTSPSSIAPIDLILIPICGASVPLIGCAVLLYGIAQADTMADLVEPGQIGEVFGGFQKYLYQPVRV